MHFTRARLTLQAVGYQLEGLCLPSAYALVVNHEQRQRIVADAEMLDEGCVHPPGNVDLVCSVISGVNGKVEGLHGLR